MILRLVFVGLFAIQFAAVSVSSFAGDWKVQDGIEAFYFDTPSLTGMLVASDSRELDRGYGKHGLRDVVFKPTGSYLNAPEGKVGAKRRHQGLLNLYRVYGDGETFGALRDDLAEVTQSANGATLKWAATEQRPSAIEAIWTIEDNRVDVDIVVTPNRDIKNFEILPATYLPVDMIKGLYVKDTEGQPVSIRLRDKPGVKLRTNEKGRPLYPFYPLGENARPAQNLSGRTTSSWNWPSYVTKQTAAIPVIFAEGKDVHVIQFSAPDSTSAVCVTPVPEDTTTNPETWNSVQQHSALYFSLFGQDVKAGGEYRARMRMIVIPAPPANDAEATHRKLYNDFLSQD